MLQKISDFIKSELQSMLKNRQQSHKFSGGFAPWTPAEALPLDPAGGWIPQTSSLHVATRRSNPPIIFWLPPEKPFLEPCCINISIRSITYQHYDEIINQSLDTCIMLVVVGRIYSFQGGGGQKGGRDI